MVAKNTARFDERTWWACLLRLVIADQSEQTEHYRRGALKKQALKISVQLEGFGFLGASCLFFVVFSHDHLLNTK